LATIIDKLIAVRTGIIAQPIMNYFNIPSHFFLHTKEEIDVMVEAVKRATLMLSQLFKL
jgi:cysteine desulfurase/selenocysteine lyase